MKRYLHFYFWLAVAVLMMCSKPILAAQRFFTHDQITDGTVIKIYPKGHYGESNMALACSGNGEYLTSYEKAGSGDLWTLVDAGDNCYYLKNNLGCYWASQGQGSKESLKCALSQLGAVKIKIKYDSVYTGWGFWHHYDFYSSLDRALNNLEGSCYKYNWWSTKDDYDGDSNSTFDIELIQDGTDAIRTVGYSGFNFRLDLQSKTATLVAGDYTSMVSNNNGKLTIPMYVSYGGKYYYVTAIDRRCFANTFGRYEGLTSITMSDHVTSLGESCFSDCVGLTKITLPRNLITLEDYCFYGCSGLTEITLPNGNVRLGNGCFERCSNLTNVILPEGIASLGKESFENCTSLTSITLPQSVKWLGKKCFYGCSALTNINLPDNITTLGEACFRDCGNLANITLPEGITTLGESCFRDCGNLANITLPEGITTLGKSCFRGCTSITDITVPKTVEKLESSLFSGCSSLANINTHNFISEYADSCFYGCKSLAKVSFTKFNWLKRLGKSCFEGCSSLTNIDIPGGVTTLGDCCFKDCKQLADITLREKVTSLGARCFANCGKLTKFSFPSTLSSIGDKVFDGIDNKIVLLCFASEPPYTSSIDCINSNCRVFVPKESLRKYGAKSYWQKAYSISPLYPSESLTVTSEVSIVKTKTTTLEYTVLPENAGNKNVRWKSENPEVASVDYKGVVTGVKVGTTKVVATTADGMNLTDSSTITVLPLTISDFSAQTMSVVRTIPTKMELSITPSEADNQKMKWTSLTPEIATVAEDGTVTGLKLGIAQLKAETTDGSNLTKTFDVEVVGLPVSTIILPSEPISVVKTKTVKIPATIEPSDADNQKLAWTSSNTDVASVDNNGMVMGKKAGKARITASATDASKVAASIEVTIEPLKIESMVFVEPKLSLVKTNTHNVILKLNSDQVDNKLMRWTSSDESVASVKQNGDATSPLEAIVTAKKVGKSIIKAEAQDGSGLSATCEVEVTPLLLTDFVANTTKVVKNVPTMMEMLFTPSEADYQKLEWYSLTPEIASVTEDGIVTGQKMGVAKLKTETIDGPKIIKTFDVRVAAIEFAEPKVSVVRTKNMTISMTSNSEKLNQDKVQWTSSDESVATLQLLSNPNSPLSAIVNAHKVGKTTIKVMSNDDSGYIATCEVEVTPLMVSDISANTTSVVKTIPTMMDVNITPTLADNQKLKWTSLTPEIATVTDDGMVTGLKMGLAQLKVETTDGSNISKTFEVQVTALPVSTISLPKESSIIKTEKKKLEYSILPLASDNQTLKWSSNAPTIATVDENSGVITTLKVGDAVITAMATDGSGVSASTMIHVIPLKVSQIGITKEMTILRTMTGQIETTIQPELADNKSLKWESDDENIATVTQDGVVKGVNVGTAQIMATTTDGSDLSAICKVTVSSVDISLSAKTIYLKRGESYASQKVNVLPENYEHKSVTCSSLDDGVASVNADGVITAVKPGVTTIKYVLDYDSNISSECKVIVYDDNVSLVDGIYYIFDKNKMEATVTNIFGGKNTSLEDLRSAQYYSGIINVPETVNDNGVDYTVKEIGDYALCGQTGVQGFYMPNTVRRVGFSAFRYDENLTDVQLSTSLRYIDMYAFGDCGFSYVDLPESLTNIQAGAFINDTHLREITFPEKLQEVGVAAFENNSALESVTFNTAIGSLSVGNNAFNQCPILNKVYVTNLNSFAQTNFNNAKANPAYTSQHIYDANGNEIINVVLTKGTKYVNNNAFNGCIFIESIEMPSTITQVYDNIFYGCSSLRDVYCYATTVPDFKGSQDPSAMADVFNATTLHVIYGNESAYKADSWWGRFYKIEGCDLPSKATSISMNHTEVTLKPDDFIQLEAMLYPSDVTNKNVTWSNSNDDVAIVTDDGFVLALAEGKTIVTAKTTDGSNLSANCVITVTGTTGIGSISLGDVKVIVRKRHLYVKGLNDQEVIQVVNTIGFTVYQGTEHEVDLDAPGIYIVKVRGKVIKIYVK